MLYCGEVVNNTYRIISEIGSGGMGVVYLAYHIRLQKNIVMKKIKSKNLDLAMLRNEADILKGLHHPYLPQVYDFIEYNNDIYTIIDYIDGYDLEYYIRNNFVFSESQLIKWLRQLCEVLNYLHSNYPPVFHTDIKPSNIIITTRGDICLIDFGISLSADDAIKGLSSNYSSPEQYYNVVNFMNGGGEANIAIDGRTDIYSLGATFYCLMSGYLPDIKNENQPKLSMYNLEYSDALIRIVDKAMERERNKRYQSAEKMLRALDNIKKQDKRYRKYVLLQVASSLAAGIFICLGIAMLFFGNTEAAKSDFIKKYNKFVDFCDSGNSDAAIEYGIDLLDSSKYKSVINSQTRADIFHSIGDCFFYDEDYYNAENYYMNAVECGKNSNKSKIYYRDYAIALIKNNQSGEAQKLLSEASSIFPDSPIISLINAEIAYKEGRLEDSLVHIDNCLSKSVDDDNKYTALILSGDIFYQMENYAEAEQRYEEAKQIFKNIEILRRLGTVYLSDAVYSSNDDYRCIRKAKEYFTEISDNYCSSAEDEINLSIAYRLSGDLEKSRQTLENIIDEYPEDCRIYIQLAFVCNELGDSQVSMYCQKARSLYKNLNDVDKQKINENDIRQLKVMYKRYCGSVW